MLEVQIFSSNVSPHPWFRDGDYEGVFPDGGDFAVVAWGIVVLEAKVFEVLYAAAIRSTDKIIAAVPNFQQDNFRREMGHRIIKRTIRMDGSLWGTKEVIV